jgi:hypothetical protein
VVVKSQVDLIDAFVAVGLPFWDRTLHSATRPAVSHLLGVRWQIWLGV